MIATFFKAGFSSKSQSYNITEGFEFRSYKLCQLWEACYQHLFIIGLINLYRTSKHINQFDHLVIFFFFLGLMSWIIYYNIKLWVNIANKQFNLKDEVATLRLMCPLNYSIFCLLYL